MIQVDDPSIPVNWSKRGIKYLKHDYIAASHGLRTGLLLDTNRADHYVVPPEINQQFFGQNCYLSRGQSSPYYVSGTWLSHRAGPGKRYTLLFEAFVLSWLKISTVNAVRKQLKLGWNAVDGIMTRAVKRGLAQIKGIYQHVI